MAAGSVTVARPGRRGPATEPEPESECRPGPAGRGLSDSEPLVRSSDLPSRYHHDRGYFADNVFHHFLSDSIRVSGLVRVRLGLLVTDRRQ